MNLLDLDRDSLATVLSELNPRDLASVRLVNNRLRDIADEVPYKRWYGCAELEIKPGLLERCPIDAYQSTYELIGRRASKLKFHGVSEKDLLTILPFLKRARHIRLVEITLEDLDGIRAFPPLESLSFSSMNVKLDYLETLFQWLSPTLTRLDFCEKLGGRVPIQSALLKLHKLRSLKIDGYNEDLTKFIRQNKRGLEELEINYKTKENCSDFKAVAELTKLRKLTVGLYAIPDQYECMCALVPSLPSTVQNFQIYTQVREELFGFLNVLPETELKVLEINWWSQDAINPRLLQHLTRFESLTSLTIDMPGFLIKKQDLKLFRRHWKNLKVLHFYDVKMATMMRILEMSQANISDAFGHILAMSYEEALDFQRWIVAFVQSRNRPLRFNEVLFDPKIRPLQASLDTLFNGWEDYYGV